MFSLQWCGARLKQQAREVHEQMKALTLGNDKIKNDLHGHFVEFSGRAAWSLKSKSSQLQCHRLCTKVKAKAEPVIWYILIPKDPNGMVKSWMLVLMQLHAVHICSLIESHLCILSTYPGWWTAFRCFYGAFASWRGSGCSVCEDDCDTAIRYDVTESERACVSCWWGSRGSRWKSTAEERGQHELCSNLMSIFWQCRIGCENTNRFKEYKREVYKSCHLLPALVWSLQRGFGQVSWD